MSTTLRKTLLLHNTVHQRRMGNKFHESMKAGRTVGPNRIPIEVVKLIDDRANGIFVGLFNTIYSTG